MKETQERHYREAWDGPFKEFRDASLMAAIGFENMFAECFAKDCSMDDVAALVPEVFELDSRKLTYKSLKLHRYGLSSLRTDLVISKMKYMERLKASAAMFSSFKDDYGIGKKIKK